ncbi:MAG: beta-lactamase family protein [Chloracidobacterium sp.]|nr:beta-lactamase family protein [Chloracidobacterium sp.]
MGRRDFAHSLIPSMALSQAPFARNQVSSATPLARAFEATRQKYNLPSLAGTIVTSKGAGEIIVTGVRKAGTDVAVTANDKWHLGSDTKVMTTCLLAALIEEKKLKWETTMAEIFPEQAKAMSPELQKLSLLHLLSHQAGLPPNLIWRSFAMRYRWIGWIPYNMPPNLIWRSFAKPGKALKEQRAAVVERVATIKLNSEPGTKYEYSNLGYVVAGAIAEKVSGKPWEALMQKIIFDPLGMKSAGFGGLGTPGRIDQPWPHRANGKPTKKNGPDLDNPAVLGPAGTVHCTLSDWAKFIADLLRGARGQDGLLKSESYKQIQTSHFEGDYALGWLVADRKWGNGKVLTHAGSNTMNFALAWVAPLRDAAFLVCTNMGGDNAARAADEITGLMIKEHFPNG